MENEKVYSLENLTEDYIRRIKEAVEYQLYDTTEYIKKLEKTPEIKRQIYCTELYGASDKTVEESGYDNREDYIYYSLAEYDESHVVENNVWEKILINKQKDVECYKFVLEQIEKIQ